MSQKTADNILSDLEGAVAAGDETLAGRLESSYQTMRGGVAGDAGKARAGLTPADAAWHRRARIVS